MASSSSATTNDAAVAAATTLIMSPYHFPTLPSSIGHVALSSKSFRVFGLNDPAWKNAREDWKRYKKNGDGGDGDGDNGDGDGGEGTKEREKRAVRPPERQSALKSSGAFGSRKNSSLGLGLGDGDGDGDDDGDDDDDDYTSSEDEAVEAAGEKNNDDDDDDDGGGEKKEEQEEMAIICEAVTTALAEDGGGFGTAGFHVSKVDDIQLLSKINSDGTSSAVYHARLVPHDSELKEPLDPSTCVSTNVETGEVKYSGNDEFYLTQHQNQSTQEQSSAEIQRLQIRITISKAKEGIAAKNFYKALFLKRKQISAQLGDTGDEIVEFDVDQWVQEDEELRELQQVLIDARGEGASRGEAVNNGNSKTNKGEEKTLGYYVEIMLIEPHVKETDIVIAPLNDLDKHNPSARASVLGPNTPTRSQEVKNQWSSSSGGGQKLRSIFHGDVFASRQFMAPGQWERANIKAYGDMGLDVRKALVRVEFPVFPEGCKDKTFREVYQLNARLKSGSFATVCRGTHRATSKKIAVKCVLRKDLPPSDDASIYDEVLILSTLRHPYICPLIDFFEERECYFLVMELMSGGDLFDRIGKRKNYTENDARDLCRKMLESVRYCHENSVAHCDMKPKNLLLVSDDDDVQMKLADFGFATRVYEPSSLTKQCGTPFFVAPEVLMRSPYDQQSDMWSCGVIMFLLLGGDLPFMARSQKELFRNIVMGRYEFEENGWAHVSEEAKSLVKQLLVTDPSQRLTSREAMNSDWMRQRGNMLMKNNLQYTSQRLKGFNARMKLRASMIAVGSVVSMRMSLRSMKSGTKLTASAGASKRPSFLNIPTEDVEEQEDDSDSDSNQ